MSDWLAELAETCEPSTRELDRAPPEGIEIAVAPDKPVPILSDAEITRFWRRAPSAGDVRGRSPARHLSAVATR